jgi:hypothetical protein
MKPSKHYKFCMGHHFYFHFEVFSVEIERKYSSIPKTAIAGHTLIPRSERAKIYAKQW